MPRLFPGASRTLPAREALARKFQTEQEKSDHYRSLAIKSHEGRVVLRGDDADALRQAYALLSKIADRLSMDDERSESAA